MQTIIVPVDGATNIKLEVLSAETLATVFSASAPSPTAEAGGLLYNDTGAELDWFDRTIAAVPAEYRQDVAAIAPVARGCSGGLIDADNRICEVRGRRLTLSYSQVYDEAVETRFADIAGPPEDFFAETGSIRDFPGALTLLKRFVFEQMCRPEALTRAEAFAVYGVLISGHFLGDDFLQAAAAAGNEHGYWMCHSGTRAVWDAPPARSTAAGHVETFGRLVPRQAAVCYRPIGRMPADQASRLGLSGALNVLPGGHDTCLSHLPIILALTGRSPSSGLCHVDGGTWTMAAQIGPRVDLPADGFRRDLLVQGTVDGQPVATARYGGGNDFKCVAERLSARGAAFPPGPADQHRLAEVAAAADAFLLPNIHPANHGTGPWPQVIGRVTNEEVFFDDPVAALIRTNLSIAAATAEQVQAVSPAGAPLVLTAGASKDSYFGRLLATLTGRDVFSLLDGSGQVVTETTTLGAAICARAACENAHPHDVDISPLGLTCQPRPAFAEAADAIVSGRDALVARIHAQK